jgi:hypothetical protein
MVPLFMALVYWNWRDRRLLRVGRGFAWAGAIVAVLWALSLLLVVAIRGVLPFLGELNPLAPSAGSILLSTMGAESWSQLMSVSWQRRFAYIGTLVTTVSLLGLAFGLFVSRLKGDEAQEEIDSSVVPEIPDQPVSDPLPGSTNFVAVMVALGALLVTALEFVYLRDQFGYRINSIFKFYFQTWILWSLAAAFAFVVLWREVRGFAGILVKAILLIVLAMSLFYPAYGFADRLGSIQKISTLTLDGSQFLADYSPDEMDAIRWLLQAPLDTIVEAVGGSYSPEGHARISEFSGSPAVLGWPGHESQWRGGGDAMGTRQSDIEILYTTRDWDEASRILQNYGIRYVIVGNRERLTYISLYEAKFQQFLKPVFQSGALTIYETPFSQVTSDR